MQNPELDIMGALRRLQRKEIVDDGTQEYYECVVRAMQVKRSGNLLPPWPPEYADPVERMNPMIFWSMARLLEEISLELRRVDPDFPPISPDTVISHLLQPATTANAREHPIFEHLESALNAQRGRQ